MILFYVFTFNLGPIDQVLAGRRPKKTPDIGEGKLWEEEERWEKVLD